MAVTTMEKITSLAQKLKNSVSGIPHLTHLTLTKGEMFGWNHTACAITYHPAAQDSEAYLLHEFGHALLGHEAYAHDIELIRMERDAWNQAQELGAQYDIAIDEDLIEDALDTYRDWLHSRSLCPRCDATGVQTDSHTYQCVACSNVWRVNEARTCALRRYSTKKRP